MNITFLGTAAATSYPLAFCSCLNCAKAREFGGKSLRKRSSIIINDDLLIDLGPDSVAASMAYNKTLTNIKYHLQTHPHSDHFDASHLTTRIPDYLSQNAHPLTICASNNTLKKMSEMIKSEGYIDNLFDSDNQDKLQISLQPINPFESLVLGKYHITALPANHDAKVEPLIYSISQNQKTLLYATDTDSISEPVWAAFHRHQMHFDIVILDHTYGLNTDSGGHLNANRFMDTINRLRSENLLNIHSRIFATHISHEGNPVHEEMVKFADTHGYEVAHDGLVVTCP
jgi:phosphoribosyl 1,2-cyclic phosphate phosphodiesterase